MNVTVVRERKRGCGYRSSLQGVNLHRSLKHGIKGQSGTREARTQAARDWRARNKRRGLAIGGPTYRNSYQCEYCDFATNNKNRFESHMRNLHPGAKSNNTHEPLMTDAHLHQMAQRQGREVNFCPHCGWDIGETRKIDEKGR